MLLWIIAIGIITIILSSKGFIGVDSFDKNSIKKYSNYLLLFSVIMFAVSFGLSPNILLSEFIPFISNSNKKYLLKKLLFSLL